MDMIDLESDTDEGLFAPTFALNGNGNGNGNGNKKDVSSSDAEDESSSDDDLLALRKRRRGNDGGAIKEAPQKRKEMAPLTQTDSEEESEEDDDEEDEEEETEESSSDFTTGDYTPPPYHDRPLTVKQFNKNKKIETILAHRPMKDDPNENEYLCKFLARSYHHVEWVDPGVIRIRFSAAKLDNYITKFVPETHGKKDAKKLAKTEEELEAEERERTGEYFDRSLLDAERIVAKGQDDSGEWHFLVKWEGTSYGDATWERADFIKSTLGLDVLIARFNERQVSSAAPNNYARQKMTPELLDNITASIRGSTFMNGCKLRDYQEKGVSWLTHNWIVKKNCILGDEMGLGKTVQVLIFFESLRRLQGIRGPFLVCAPLATLGHWHREAALWTDMNVISYLGILPFG